LALALECQTYSPCLTTEIEAYGSNLSYPYFSIFSVKVDSARIGNN